MLCHCMKFHFVPQRGIFLLPKYTKLLTSFLLFAFNFNILMWGFVKWLSLKVVLFMNSGALRDLTWKLNTGLYGWYEIFACFSYKNKPLYYKHPHWFCKQCLYYFIQTWLAILAILQSSTWSLCTEVQLIFITWPKSKTLEIPWQRSYYWCFLTVSKDFSLKVQKGYFLLYRWF